MHTGGQGDKAGGRAQPFAQIIAQGLIRRRQSMPNANHRRAFTRQCGIHRQYKSHPP
jgi:hypothetical protein